MTTLPTVTEAAHSPRDLGPHRGGLRHRHRLRAHHAGHRPFARSFDVGVTAGSIIVSAFAFFRLVFAPAGGRLIAKFGERRFTSPVCSSSPSPRAQRLSRRVTGRSCSSAASGASGRRCSPSRPSRSSCASRLPTIQGRVSSACGSAFLLGGIGGPVLGGLLGNLGLRIPFLVYAVALVIAAAIVAAMIRTGRCDPLPMRPNARSSLCENLAGTALIGPRWDRRSPMAGPTSGCATPSCRSSRRR